jgi:hypothetical protein
MSPTAAAESASGHKNSGRPATGLDLTNIHRPNVPPDAALAINATAQGRLPDETGDFAASAPAPQSPSPRMNPPA